MRSGQRSLAVREQLLVELLSGAEAGELDPDVVRAQSGKPDHVARQVEDLDGFAHLQHEDLAVVSHQARLEHELRGLGDQHEITGNLRVSYRERAAAGDLLAKLGDDAAGAAEHVSETDHYEMCPSRALQ